MSLLYTCASWHGLAKLRMHTDLTLSLLQSETERLGAELRHFAEVTCKAFDTEELKREVDARKRRHAKKSSKSKTTRETDESENPESGPKKKEYSLRTYKHHSLPDYVNNIREFGTTDSYSTEPVSATNIPPSPSLSLTCPINTARA